MACIFTSRNEVVAKVMFLHVSVILSTGGGGWGSPGRENPPWTGKTPLGREKPPRPGRPTPHQADPPDQADTPPPTRQNPPWQGGTPRTRQTPPAGRNPPGKQTPEYGLRAASTHPTGMHSCCNCIFLAAWPSINLITLDGFKRNLRYYRNPLHHYTATPSCFSL